MATPIHFYSLPLQHSPIPFYIYHHYFYCCSLLNTAIQTVRLEKHKDNKLDAIIINKWLGGGWEEVAPSGCTLERVSEQRTKGNGGASRNNICRKRVPGRGDSKHKGTATKMSWLVWKKRRSVQPQQTEEWVERDRRLGPDDTSFRNGLPFSVWWVLSRGVMTRSLQLLRGEEVLRGKRIYSKIS